MTLILIYKDTMVCDRLTVLDQPHAFGAGIRKRKLMVAKSNRFAFAIAGPTLTRGESSVLEGIIEEAFLNAKGDRSFIPIGHPGWMTLFSDRNPSTLIMTRRASYCVTKRKGDEYWLKRIASSIPLTYGTGSFSASVCALEGVPMDTLVPVVASIVTTVSSEFDLIRKANLSEMNHE